MAGGRVKFGLALPNRGVVIGVTTAAEMLQLAADAESSGWDSVWVGDSSLFRSGSPPTPP
jgi:alkanesulfonate monooxygenase SsuD/methylene tetrahydromethanopterin reductase-like flavin-dependent oxidoreductase (luciferase family)